jgi:exodeoxyribonuclease X
MVAIIFDTESTGLVEPRLIEAAWIKVPNPNTLSAEEQFLQRYSPGKPIQLGALATHHIYDEELADCPPYTEFSLPAGTEYLVGHNIDYDWKVIGEPQIKRICTLALTRYLWPGLDSYSQSAILYFFERARARELLKAAHSALQDVVNCLTILRHLVLRFEPTELVSWEAVWRLSEKARIPKVMTFGKHKGAAISEVPADYKRWLLRQPDTDVYLAKALRGQAA